MSSNSGLSTTTGLQSQTQKATLRSSMAGEQSHVRVLTSEIAITCDIDERATGGNFHHMDPDFQMNGNSMSAQRETNILDDGDEGTSAAVVSNSKGTGLKHPVLSTCEYSAQSEDAGDGVHLDDTQTRTSSNPTHKWVTNEHQVSAGSHMYPMADRLEQKVESGIQNYSMEAEPGADKDDEFASLALDIDQSIEQLNQLILDLDPEFEPVPTLARGHMTCSNSLRTNGFGHLVGQAKSNQSGKISPR